MSNEDSFINEVTEEVRRDRLFALFRRYGWIAALLVVLIVGGAAWNEWRKAQIRAEAEARGDAILGVLEAESPEARLAGLEAMIGDSDTDALIGLLTAAQSGTLDEARARLETVAADPAAPQLYRDLATLKSMMLASGAVPPAERISRLEPLTAPGSPFRALALEQTALAEVEAGDTEAALSILTALIGDADASQGLRRRASQLIVALGGSLDAS